MSPEQIAHAVGTSALTKDDIIQIWDRLLCSIVTQKKNESANLRDYDLVGISKFMRNRGHSVARISSVIYGLSGYSKRYLIEQIKYYEKINEPIPNFLNWAGVSEDFNAHLLNDPDFIKTI